MREEKRGVIHVSKKYMYKPIRKSCRNNHYVATPMGLGKNNKINNILKCIFFGIVCLIYISICVLGMLVVYNISKKSVVSYSDIGVALTGFGSVLGSTITLPKIIGKHLFPEHNNN